MRLLDKRTLWPYVMDLSGVAPLVSMCDIMKRSRHVWNSSKHFWGLNKVKIQRLKVGKDINHIRIVIENGFSCMMHSLITKRPLIMHSSPMAFVHYSTAVSWLNCVSNTQNHFLFLYSWNNYRHHNYNSVRNFQFFPDL